MEDRCDNNNNNTDNKNKNNNLLNINNVYIE